MNDYSRRWRNLMRKICLAALFCLPAVWSLLSPAAAEAGVAQPFAQTYFVPQPAQHMATLFNSLNSNVNTNAVHQLVSIVIHQPGTIIVYDHWEDGYETDPSNPVQPTTQIWGDGNPAHGMPPGYTNNVLNVGDVITLESDIYMPRVVPPSTNGTPVLGDGGDRISSTRLIGTYTAGWPIPDPVNFAAGPDPGYQIADMMAMYPTKMWGTNFTLPLGTNVVYPTVGNPIFQYVSVMVQAMQDNTSVTITNPVVGAVYRTLSRGETWFFGDGDIPAGTAVFSTAPVQVDLVTGRIGVSWECRAFPIVPTVQWGTSYWTPVSCAAAHPATVFFYNPRNSSITVSITTTTGAKTPVTVAANSWSSYTMVDGEAAHFFSANTFWAASAQDTVNGGNWSFESGFPLVNEAWLNTDFRAAWANGTVGGTVSLVPNGNPLWVTPLTNTTIYVDYDGNPATGALTDPNGDKCDVILSASVLTQYKVFNNVAFDQTGMRIYTLDGTKLSVAYAEDADVAQAQQNIDVGCTVVTFNNLSLGDVVWLDLNGNGVQDTGEPGLANVKLTLTSSQGTVVTYTDSSGRYLFPDLSPGVAYTVTVDPATLPSGLTASYAPSMPRTLNAYQGDLTVDFGYKGAGAIGTKVWNDFIPPDAIQELNEPGMVNVGVIVKYAGLDGVFGTIDDLTFTRYTDVAGNYAMTNLPYGNYQVQVDPSTYSSAFEFTTTNYYAPTLTAPSPAYLTANFGLYHPPVKALYFNYGATGTNGSKYLNRDDPVWNGSNLTWVASQIGGNSSGETVFVDDRFLKQDYNNNDGSIVWSSGWIETDNNQGATANPALAGDIQILSTNVLQITTAAVNEEIRRGVDLSRGAATATLSFKVVYNTLNATNNLAVEASYDNGTNWSQLGVLINNNTNGTYTRALTVGSATAFIRFRVNARTANQALRIYDCRVDIARGSYSDLTKISFLQNQPFASAFTPLMNGTVTASAFIAAPQGNIPTNTANISATIKTIGGTIIATMNPATVTPLTKPFEHSVSDNFETGDYTGNTGSDPWRNVPGIVPATNAWQEVGETDGAILGDIRVIYDSSSSVLRIQNANHGAYRVADLSFATYARLSFAYRLGSMMTNVTDGLLVQVSTNGTVWNTLDTLKGPIMTTYSNVTYDVTGYISTNTYVRFYQTSGYNTIYINDVMLYWGQKLNFYKLDWAGTVTATPTVPVGQGLQCDVTTSLGGNAPFSIQYGSLLTPSAVNLSAATIINIDSVAVYSNPYPSVVLITNGDFAQTNYIRVSVSDPFGSNDVSGVSILIQDPTGYTTNIAASNIVFSTASTRVFELAWGPFNAGGVYSIAAAAAEGTEGIRASSSSINYRVKMNVSGRVVNDVPGSGIFTNSGAMAGITNVPVALYTDPNGDGNPADGVRLTNTLTGANGAYQFLDVTNGYYVIVETNLLGWTSTSDAVPPNNDLIPFHLLYTNLTGLNFLDSSNSQLATVTGRVINDQAGYGDLSVRQAMPGITNATVVLYTDPNGDGDPADGVIYDTTLSGANGTYTFNNVPPGTYVALETNLLGWTSVNDAIPPNDDRIAIVRTGGISSTNNDFLDSQTPHLGSIGDTIFWDVNGNGLPDTGEGLAGVTVFVDNNNNGIADPTEPQDVTDANGNYTLTGLAVGNYTVKVATNTLPAGMANTTDPDGGGDSQASYTLTTSQMTITSADFGYTGSGTIGTTIFLDSNTNNVPNGGEGIVNAVVYVDRNHNGVRDPGEPYAISFSANGTYSITNIPAGSFDVKVDISTLPAGVVNTVDPDGLLNSQSTITLTAGQNVTTANWGYQLGGAISGTIYNDSNTNSVQDILERGLSGVVVGLYYTNGNPVLDASSNAVQVITDINGFYQFTSVVGGRYLIQVDPAGNTLPAQSPNSQDPDGPAPWGDSQAITNLSAGATVAHMDFGYVVPKFVNKTVQPNTSVNAGAILTYTLQPGYGGNELLVNVTVSDIIPSGTTYYDNATPNPAAQPAVGTNGTVTWNLGSNTSGSPSNQVATAGTSATFGAAIPIDNSAPSPSNSLARVATGIDGSVHVVYYNQNSNKVYYTKSLDNGGTWFNPVDISSTNANFANTNVALAVDAAGNVHVAMDYKAQRIYYRRFTVSGTTNSPSFANTLGPVTIDTGSLGNLNWLPEIACAPDGSVHVVYNYNNQRTYYTKSLDNGTNWASAVEITSTIAARNDRYASLAVDSSGYVHAVMDNAMTRIYYFKFKTSGTTLLTNIAPKTIDTGSTGNFNRLPHIAVDPSGVFPQPLHVVFLYTNLTTRRSFYTTSTSGGTNWSTSLNVAANGGTTDNGNAIAVDDCGNIHLAINQNNQNIWYTVSTNAGASFRAQAEIDTAAGNSADRFPSIAASGDTVYAVFDHSTTGRIYCNDAALINCETITTNTLAATHTLVANGDPITITMTVTSPQAVTNIQPVGLPIATNAAGGVTVSNLTAVFAGPTNIAAGGSVTFTWTATAVAGTTVPGSIAFVNSAIGTNLIRGTPVHFNQALANSVLVSPPLTFQVAVNNPPTVTDVLNQAELRDQSILANGIPSSLVDTPVNVNLDFGDLPDFGTNGPNSYTSNLTNNGPRHIQWPGNIYLGTTPTDTETNAWLSANADGDNTHGTNDENGIVFSELVRGATATITVTNVSGVSGVLNAWADWNNNGIFDASERIFSNLVLSASITASNLPISIPPGATLGATGFRFRVTNQTGQGGDSPLGLAVSGEVEDYRPTVVAPYISGRVINDTNGFGDLTTRASMPGITNVTLTLYTDPNGDGNPGDGAIYATTTSGTNGYYIFTNVPAGTYVVVESNLPTWTSVNDTVPPNDDWLPVNRVGYVPSSGNDFLDTQTPHLGALGDTIFWDVNGNNTADAGEGLAGVQVFVDNNNNGVAESNEPQTTTDSSGHYLITSLPVGTHLVRVNTNTMSAGMANTLDPDGLNDSKTMITLSSGQLTNLTANFGYRGSATIGTTIYLDANTNNVFNAGEGISNAVVYVDLNHNGLREPGEPYATSAGANGAYLITNLPAGTFDVKVDTTTLAANLVNTVDPDGINNSQTSITLTSGQNATTANWGYQVGGTLSGYIYSDATTNLVFDAGDLPLPGITLGLFQANGTTPILDGSGNPLRVTTDGSGFYQFTGLAGTNYIVKVDPLGSTLPAQSTNKGDPDGPSPNGDNRALESLPIGGSITNQNFGYVFPSRYAKAVSPATSVNPGAVLTYTLRPSYGNLFLTNASVGDTVPLGSVYNGNAAPTPAAQPSIGGAGTVTWNLGTNVGPQLGIQPWTNGGFNAFGAAAQINNNVPASGNSLARVATGRDGTVHVIFNSGTTNTFYTKSTDGGATWWNAVKISATTTNADKNADLAVDSSNYVHVVYDSNSVHVYYFKFQVTGTSNAPTLVTNLAPRVIDANAGSFTTALKLPNIALGKDDSVHVTFNYNNQRTYYTKSTNWGGTWFVAQDITSTTTLQDRNASLAVDASNYVHAVMGNGVTNVYYRKFQVGGTTNAPTLTTALGPKLVTTNAPSAANILPKIAVDPTAWPIQPVHVVYINSTAQDCFYTGSWDGGVTWSLATMITERAGAGTDVGAAIAVDNCGNVHVVLDNSSTNVWHTFNNSGYTNFTAPVLIGTAGAFNRLPAVATSSNGVYAVFDRSDNGQIYVNRATLVPCEIQTTNSLSITPSLVTSNDPVTIAMTIVVTQAVNNLQPVGLPIITNAAGGATLSALSAVYVGPTNLAAGASATFTWTATALSSTVLPSSLAVYNSATALQSARSNILHFKVGVANSVLISPPLTFQVTVNNPATVTEVTNSALLRDVSWLSNGIPSAPVTNAVNVSLDFGDLPDYGTNGPLSYTTLLARNGPRHIVHGADIYIGTIPTDSESNAWQNPTATGDNTNGTNDENGVVFGSLTPGQPGVLTITNVSGVSGVLNAWADWNTNGVFDANERILNNVTLAAGITATNLTINVPANAAVASTAFRFRVTNLTGQGGDSPTGLASSGEVEDYFAPVSQPSTINGRVYYDYNLDGQYNGGDTNFANVTVQLSNALGQVYYLQTDTNGLFSQTVPPGAWVIRVSTSSTNLSQLYLTTDTYGQGHNPSTNTVVAGGSASQSFGFIEPGATLALLRSMQAYASSKGVAVRWETATEVGSVSFDLFRRAADGSAWVQVNAQPVFASNALTGGVYEVLDSAAVPGVPATYQVVEWDERGARHELAPRTLTALAAAPAPKPAAPKSVRSVPQARRTETGGASTELVSPVELGVSKLLKLSTSASGVYCLRAATLASLLNQPLATVQQWIAQGNLGLTCQGQSVTGLPAGDGSALYFYAEAFQNNYATGNVYWAVWRPNSVPFTVDGGLPAASANAYYLATVNCESNVIAAATLPVNPDDDYWMWSVLNASAQSALSASFSFAADNLALSSGATARVTVDLFGGNESVHGVIVKVNGQPIGQGEWSGLTAQTFAFDAPLSALQEGTNALTITAVHKAGTPNSRLYVNRFAVQYPRQYLARGGAVEFGANGNAVVSVGGFATPDITVLDVSSPKEPMLVTNLTLAPQGGYYQASFVPLTPASRYVAFEAASAAVPSALLLKPAGLASVTNQAACVIIASGDFAATAGELAAYREQQGLPARVVTIEQIYNEFGYGLPSPSALSNFLAAAYWNWSAKPRYATLVGKGTYDYRNLLGYGDNLIPPQMIRTPVGLFCSDSIYGDINGDGVPELAVGRLPVLDTNALAQVIAKIKAYEALPASSTPLAFLLADQADQGGDFGASLASVAGVLSNKFSPQSLTVTADTDLAAVRAAVQTSWAQGLDLVSYLGHGAVDRLGEFGYLTADDVATLPAGPRQPVLVAATCTIGNYAIPAYACLAESLLVNSNRGAIAVVGPTGLSWNNDAALLNRQFAAALRANAWPRLGDSLRRALGQYAISEQQATQPWLYNLIGDPATLYRVPADPAPLQTAPSVSIVAPTNAILTAPGNLTVSADAFSLDGVVQRVDYYDNGRLIGQSFVYPFTLTLGQLPVGSRTLMAVAYDNFGNSTTSIVQQLVVPNVAPSASLASPLNGQRFDAPADITLAGNVNDMDGWVTEVQFYAGQTLCGVATNAPYSLTLSNLAAGTYVFQIVAKDNLAAQGVSSMVAVEVLPFRITSVNSTNQQMSLEVAGGRPPYVLDYMATLGTNSVWQPIATNTAKTFAVPAGQSGGFYRVRASQ